MRILLPLFLLLLPLQACEINPEKPFVSVAGKKDGLPIPASIGEVPTPTGYQPIATNNNLFGAWLTHLPLRKDNLLRIYDGSAKPNQSLHYAILDVPYNRNPLQQCADAIMRLRAEYLYEKKPQATISFLHQHGQCFTCPTQCSRKQLEQYLQKVFSWCGTYNLQAQLRPVRNINNIKAGDVFIKAGSPGHAMLVANVAINKKGEKIFLLLQSFIPAQEIHLVKNLCNEELGPWYAAKDSVIATQGWRFTPSDLREW